MLAYTVGYLAQTKREETEDLSNTQQHFQLLQVFCLRKMSKHQEENHGGVAAATMFKWCIAGVKCHRNPQEPQTAVPFQYMSTSHIKINTHPDIPANPLSPSLFVTPARLEGCYRPAYPG